ncbi:MAG TPA: type II secretion system secretin GspD, partial [bacterium]|nr:type II secretion system secretin GspD [bacterium]
LIFTLILSPVLSLAQDEEGGRTVRLPQAGDVRTVPLEQDPVPVSPSAEEDDLVYLNVQDQDIKDIIKQISKATGKNFIIDDKIRGKVTILSERKMTKEEAYQAFLSALEVGGFTTVTGPGGIIKIVALKDAISSPIPIYVDSTPETDSYVTRLISLQNISALDMSSAIKDLISKNGNMFAYPSTNTLVITDSGTNIDRLMKIIKELDQEGPQQVLEIVPINYADATQVAATVLNIFEIEQQSSRGTTARPTATTRRGATTGSQLEELKEVSKIIADERTNSIIVYASKRAIGKVREVIAKLDVPLDMGEGGNIHVHYLKYANAMEMAETLSAITSGARSMGTAKGAAKGDGSKGAAGTAVASFGDEIKIGADETTNALIITSSAKDYKRLVDELISKLDVPRRQVYLESIVMELSVTRGSTAGATGYGGGTAGSLIGFGGSSFSGMNPAQFFTPTGLFSQPGLLGGLLSRDTITIDIPSSGGGSQELTIPAFAAFLNFLQTQSQANIVSTPNILTLDNQEASIDVSKTIYAKKSTTIANAGTTTFEPTPLEAGLMLKITPQITEGDSVRLQIHHKLSNFTSVPNPDTGAADTTKREIQTTVVAMDGQTVVLGGLMEDMDTSNRSKIPLLGDIPILGWLFQYRSKQGNKTNLLVFITPYVIRDPSDFAEITKRKIQQRNDFVSNNFGRRQQRQINESLAAHRADLLDYAPRPAVPVSSSGQNYQQPGTAPLAVSQPVITVAPLGADGAPQMQYLAPPPQLAPQQSTAPGTPKLNQKGSPDFGY